MNEPKVFLAGDKIEWTESLSDYLPSAGWTLKYILINSLNRYPFNSIADGESHKVTLLNADTNAWVSGDYLLQPYVENTDGTQELLPVRSVTIKQNIITATTYDFRTHAKKTLESIEAAIENRAGSEAMSLSITTRGGSTKALQYLTHKELIEAKNYYEYLVESELQQEKIEAGIEPGNKILISFK
ncbi:MAG: hypothetical protein IPL84_03750 [Chitinophagaceae bacterium]|nr:hypothetical protein [Chitinophagaceae bacterium]